MDLLAYSPLAGGRLSGKYIGNLILKMQDTLFGHRRFSRHHTERGEVAIDKYVSLQKNME